MQNTVLFMLTLWLDLLEPNLQHIGQSSRMQVRKVRQVFVAGERCSYRIPATRLHKSTISFLVA